mgnify:CR=1 FL=1
MSNILIVDATNLFLRNYAARPNLDVHGNPNGGVVGFMISLNKIMSLCNPSKVILCWDAEGGSARRRKIIETYKDGRKPTRLNRNFEFELDNPTKNKIEQRLRLGEYLKDLPVYQVGVPDIEADDSIAFLCKYFSEEHKTIASSDKDFFQMISDEKISMYSLSYKTFVKDEYILEKFGVYSVNFVLARSIVGDKSDNLSGVKGLGFKKLLKSFPQIKENKKITLEEMFDFCASSKDKILKNIIENKNIIEDNYKVMRLDTTLVSANSVNSIIEMVKTRSTMNSTSFKKKMMEDGITTISDSFMHSFRILEFKERNI